MNTTKGWIPRTLLRHVSTEKKVPCGVLIIEQYFEKKSGELVRQDIEVRVDKGILLAGETGVKK